ncbi:MAG: tetratricopeptide repeat protein [Taibaiella sp.]|nr:tetratricopeptide repeat protein [Taibaiella sp.]
MANTLQSKGQLDLAVRLYEKAAQSEHRISGFEGELLKLYLENGEIEKVFPIYYKLYPYQTGIDRDIKSRLVLLIEKDERNKEKIRKSVKKLIDKDPAHKETYASILSWINQLDGQYDGALEELIRLDKKEKGSMTKDIYELAEQALENRRFSIANQAFGYILNGPKEDPYYAIAERRIIRSHYVQLVTTRPVDPKMVDTTRNLMLRFFQMQPDKMTDIEYLWYMDVIGKYARQPRVAISLLDSVLQQARLSKEYIGMAKLALGDYQLLAGDVWDANLTYAQVDKLYRQDMMGEEARFKQAKLAFYRGDFEWAQNQLKVLKASTTELISNDAMSLSIMITENTVTDTSAVPLKMFAQADLMIFQYQFPVADSILNELIKDYPESDLIDDVYMLKARMARDEGRFNEAVAYFEKVIQEYKDGVLADDALMQCAEIYEIHLADKDKAIQYYEDLILNMPSSTLSTLARAKLTELQKQAAKP